MRFCLFCWLKVLYSWLNSSFNYEEVIKWYLGWKSTFSDALLSQPLIKEKFSEVLNSLGNAVSSGMYSIHTLRLNAELYSCVLSYDVWHVLSTSTGGYVQPGARENIAYLTQTERRKDFQYEAMQERRDAESVSHRGGSTSVENNFENLIHTKADENNIVFMPLVGRRHENKQLYTFGRIVIYMDRGVVFVKGEKTWVPTSLQSLIDMAKWGGCFPLFSLKVNK